VRPAVVGQPLEGAIDPEAYVLGPGDLLEVVYVGRALPAERVRVSPSGRINLSPTGPVHVAGLTLQGAQESIREVLSRFYDDTRISVDLLEVRTFQVHLLGRVENPGTRTVSAASRPSDLFQVGSDLEPEASHRNLQLRRRGRTLTVDLVRYRYAGHLEANPFLEDGDVLYVPAKLDSVSVFGWVTRPGFIEYREGDTVDDLLALAGGFESGADARNVELLRPDLRDPTVFDRFALDILSGEGNRHVQPADGVYVRAQPDWPRERLVELTGEVRYPGVYAIAKGEETLASLVERAGGFTEDADPRGTQVFRPDVFDRPEDDPEFQRLQTMPISEMSGDEYEYLKLRYRQREGAAAATLSERLVDVGNGEDLLLRGGDTIEVPRKNLAVDVQGSVRSPGFVPYCAERTVKEYIELAGGLAERARTGRIRIIRNLTGERVKAHKDTRIYPGDTIWVPEKPYRDWWRITRETVMFLAQVGTLIVVIKSVND
jgi:protein involved in polysaccharide export with SLBB domain